MKKIIGLLLTVIMLALCLLSCGQENKPSKASSEEESRVISSSEEPSSEEKTEEAVTLRDGTYEMDLTFSGGSGRATITSPAKVTVAGERIEAELVWSSRNYIYMLIDDVKYEPVNQEGNSTFRVPVILDRDMKVIGCTVAMSEPHEIEYTLHFDSSSAR